jgi:hypothetical protein
VPIAQLLNATFAAAPLQELMGPYNNLDAGTELISVRNVVGIPHWYLRHFIPGPLSPRLAWEIVAHDIIANGDAARCAPVLDFIRLLCTIQVAGDTASPLAMGPFIVPLLDANLVTHCATLVQHKLPGLNQTPTMAAGQAIAASVSKLATEQRAYCQDMANRHAITAQKTVDDYLGASLHALLRICHVENVAALPPIYKSLADHGRKKHRTTMQQGMGEMLNRMGLSDLQCIITADLATKISGMMWINHLEDLGVGIHPFVVGEMNPDTIVAMQELPRNYDLIALGAVAPNLADCRSLLVGAMGKVSKPSSLIALDSQNHIFLAFLNVFLGQGHPVSMAWGQHTHTTKFCLSLLQRVLQFYQPRTPRHAFLLPALVQQWAQLRWNYWLQCQHASMTNVLPPDWEELWKCIQLKTDWELPLPERYLTPNQPVATVYLPPLVMDPSATMAPSAPVSAPHTAPATPAQPNAPVRSLSNKDCFLPFKETGQQVREVPKKAIKLGQHLPKNAQGKDMCVSYHVKGICNSRCCRIMDHRVHNATETQALLDWCKIAFGGKGSGQRGRLYRPPLPPPPIPAPSSGLSLLNMSPNLVRKHSGRPAY